MIDIFKILLHCWFLNMKKKNMRKTLYGYQYFIKSILIHMQDLKAIEKEQYCTK